MRSASLVAILFILGAAASPLPSSKDEVSKRAMDGPLPSILVYTKKDNAKREPIDSYQPERPVADAITVEDKKVKRRKYAWWPKTESDDEDLPSV